MSEHGEADQTSESSPYATTGGASERQAPRTRSTRVACTSCRQSKVRCTGPDGGNCMRCSRLDLDCMRDVEYKRVSKSRKVAELEKQVQYLTSAVLFAGESPRSSHHTFYDQTESPPGPAQGTTAQQTLSPSFNLNSYEVAANVEFPSPGSSQGPPHKARYMTSSGHPSHSGQSNSRFPGSSSSGKHSNNRIGAALPPDDAISRPLGTSPRNLDPIQLAPQQIDDLFQIFFRHYHPLLPFLDPSMHADACYQQSSLLFWTIIGVSCRRYRDDVTLLTALTEPVTKLIWASIANPPYTIGTVQAIIIICCWPFPVTSAWNDTLITLSNIAISIAMQIGLHRPLNAQDFTITSSKANMNMDSIRLRTCTWAAANIVSQAIGAIFGQLPNSPFDWTINQACESSDPNALPEELRLKLMLQRYCDRVTKLMCGDNEDCFQLDSSRDQSMVMVSWAGDLGILETKLDAIEHQFDQQLSLIDRIYIANARLYTRSMFFFDSSDTESRKSNVIRAYAAAVTLISLAVDADKECEYLLHIPWHQMRMILLAVCVVLKISNSSYALDIDFESRRKIFNKGLSILTRCNLANDDTPGKATRMMAQAWHSGNKSRQQFPPELLVRSRLGASLIYEFLWIWRQEFGGGSSVDLSTIIPSHEQCAPQMFSMNSFFQDAAEVNLDFLAGPAWNLGFDNGA